MSNKLEWFIPDSEGVSPVGPFSTEEILARLLDGKLKFEDFISCPAKSGEKWLRIFNFSKYFSEAMPQWPICPPPKTFSKGVHQEQETSEILVSPDQEVSLEANIIIHDDIDFYKGVTTTISEKEIQFETTDSIPLTKGCEVVATIFSSKGITPFSVLSVVLDNQPREFGYYLKLYFIRINPENKRKISDFIRKSIHKDSEVTTKT